MPRISREFVKIEIRLLNDHRFFTLGEWEQLIYIKLLGVAKATQNKIPKNLSVIRAYLRTNRSETDIRSVLRRIKVNFPKFKETKYFYYFDGWNERFNNNLPFNSQNAVVDLDEDKDLDKDGKRKLFSPPSLEDVNKYIILKNLAVDSEKFINFYESKNWMVGKNKMTNWKAALSGWANRDQKPKVQYE